MPRTRTVRMEDVPLDGELDPARSKGDQIRERLEQLAERLGPGSTMPSDRQLAEHFGVARMTVRSEIRRLVEDGVLDVKQGRGTFVAEGREPHGWGVSYSTSTDPGVPGSRIVEREITLAGDRGAKLFDVPTESLVLRLTRLRTLDDDAVGLERVVLPLHRFPGLEDEKLDRVSLYRVLEERWGVRRATMSGTARALLPTPEDAELLGIPLSEPCIAVRMISRDADGYVYESGRSVYRGDRYELAVDIPLSSSAI